MPPRGFGVAAGFCVFQLWIQEGMAAPALSASHPDSVAESFLNVGNVVMRTRPGGKATCGRRERGTSPQSLSPAAKHPWRGACLQTPETSSKKGAAASCASVTEIEEVRADITYHDRSETKVRAKEFAKVAVSSHQSQCASKWEIRFQCGTPGSPPKSPRHTKGKCVSRSRTKWSLDFRNNPSGTPKPWRFFRTKWSLDWEQRPNGR